MRPSFFSYHVRSVPNLKIVQEAFPIFNSRTRNSASPTHYGICIIKRFVRSWRYAAGSKKTDLFDFNKYLAVTAAAAVVHFEAIVEPVPKHIIAGVINHINVSNLKKW
jgi:hypothetical protein